MRWLRLPSGLLVNIEQLVFVGTLRLDVPESIIAEYPDLRLAEPNRVMSTGARARR